ncbi:tRNA-intron endonuclease [Coprinopsis sp. MPI-PUGE-AT-0042]|nr:tRNA-intron endonuclease [Coprinopsis sp. MPI-PUGE-AT-0042]
MQRITEYTLTHFHFSSLKPPPSKLGSVLGLLGLSLPTRIENPHVEGIFDPVTRSVWISNMDHSMILWRRGFFRQGKACWETYILLNMNSNFRKGTDSTSEEVTARRRAERKQFKLDRARAIAAVAQEAEERFEKEGIGPAIPSGATWKPSQPIQLAAPKPEELGEPLFLAWNSDCLTILHPDTVQPMSLHAIWTSFQRAHLPLSIDAPQKLQFDNPFPDQLRRWVVKGGIKFCVDYLLYKRGPVFSHAEFALVVMPVYEDEQDQEESITKPQNAEPFAWSWLSTINRVNSQVQKTLIFVYVTIPSKSRLSQSVLESPACFQHYSVREVVLRRFVPARMRD